jgi:hypothetical protein
MLSPFLAIGCKRRLDRKTGLLPDHYQPHSPERENNGQCPRGPGELDRCLRVLLLAGLVRRKVTLAELVLDGFSQTGMSDVIVVAEFTEGIAATLQLAV